MRRIAEALVECGHAKYGTFKTLYTGNIIYIQSKSDRLNYPWLCEVVDPFADTLEGRRQADALAEWFFNKHRGMWDALQFMKHDEPYNNHKHLCKQLHTGFEQLEKQE